MSSEFPAPDGFCGVDEGEPFLRAWVRGVDYVSQWAEADAAVAEFYRALEAAGVKVEDIRLTASTDGEGVGVVRGCSSAASLREVARLVLRGAGVPDEDEAG